MQLLSSHKARCRARLNLALVATMLYALSLFLALGADAKPDKGNKDPKEKQKTEKKTPKATPAGAELYSIHCGRCHPERYATERSPAQWKTLMAHMRVRANLPAKEAKAILKYLQEDSGTP